MNNLLSASAAANRLGVPATTFRDWIRDGRVPGAVKVSNMWLVPDDITLDDIDIPKMGRPPKKEKNGTGPLPSLS